MSQISEALEQVARRIPDDIAGERLSGQVTQMVTVVRRRRVARLAARSMGGLGIVAMVAMAATSLSDARTADPRPASPGVGVALCGLTTEQAGWTPTGAVVELQQTLAATAADGSAAITISTDPGALPGGLAAAELPRFVAVDPATGVIVGVQGNDDWLPLREPSALTLRMLAEERVQMRVEFISCGNESNAPDPRLPAGNYDVYVLQALQSHAGASRYGLGGPSRLTVEKRQ
ncbi:hypothetical protein [Actinotalea sp. K2]|uniref:hypothetical protein n=1 Tax=Actinotalea sp. K2 TaxID=2939438 RepID=UPI0020176BB8|nr:hypothetical protein [Actinotalea sp. K2]MCL3859559.1 hypothetical protein [Actinotalea sp. K2]